MAATMVAKRIPQPEDSEGRRRCMRVALHRGGIVRPETEAAEHVAFVRDFNFNGIYLFSNFKPVLGSSLEIAFSVPDSACYKRFQAQGRVVRVEPLNSGVVGIAAEFQQCELSGGEPA